ncbi:MAG: ComEC family competence protein [Bacteroidota bacterium]|jgi:beta-lactamase superfamily II metal-dependent hydrolase|nr:ComEC family competence protein [Bacteroidota bacterium]
MQIEIKMLNVNDGDAIIVCLSDSAKHLVVLIDGGHKNDDKEVIKQLKPFLTNTGKLAPDLIICTHYDTDHIAGLLGVIDYYGKNIGEVWLHHPGISVLKLFDLLSSSYNPLAEPRSLSLDQRSEVHMLREQLSEANLLVEGTLVIESYADLQKLVPLIKSYEIKLKEPFFGDCVLADWPELEILGPTKDFYKELFPQDQSISDLIMDQAMYSKELKEKLKLNEKLLTDACRYLDTKTKDKVTKVNQASVILLITVEENKYLFTGDASLESFLNIPAYKNKLRNLYWLKVPHHGSHNNISSELIQTMSPKYAYISGKIHFDAEVKDCLENKNAIVQVTCIEEGHLIFKK